MRFKIQAGAEIEALTPSEARDMLAELMTGWRAEIARGVRFRHAGDQAAASAAGAYNLSTLGPDPGMIWEVTRVTITGLTAAETVSAYINDTSGVLAAGNYTATVNQIIYGQRSLVLNSADRLVVAGSGLTANKQYAVALQVIELPVQLGGRLL